jgi:predicted RNase H-like HicB family nuclease
MRYTVILEQESDGSCVVGVPALPDSVSRGENREEALANIREAIAVSIEHLNAHGKPVPNEVATESIDLDDLEYGT